MIAISVNDLALRYGVVTIFENISFSIEENDRLGVVGVNGCGKSSLFKLITGEYTTDEGSVFIGRGKTVGMLAQDNAFRNTAEIGGHPIGGTVLEQMYAAFPHLILAEYRLAELEQLLKTTHGAELDRLTAEFTSLNQTYISEGGLEYKSRCASFLEKLGFDKSYHGMEVSDLSGGQRTRLALARLLSQEPDILMLDEPTNHLDTATMEWLEKHLATYKKTVMLISHDRYFLDRVTNKTLEIEHRHAKLYNGNYTAYVEKKEKDREVLEHQYKNQQKEIARLEAYIAQQRAWNRERNIIAAESREKALARMTKIEKPKDAPKSIRFTFTESHESGNDVLTVKGLSMAFGEHRLFRELSFLLKKKERLFVLGPNGCGKSTFIKLLMGQLSPTGGKLEFGYNVTIGYYDQENQNLDPEKTILDELWDAYPSLTQTEIRNTLALFRFTGDDIEKTVSLLSGGERARLTLAKLILSKMNVLILDEPTNHLDIASREALENALSAFDGTIIAVSHDRYFVSRLATRFLHLSSPDTYEDFTGSYEEFCREQERRAELAKGDGKAQSVASNGKDEYLQAKQEAAKKRKDQKRRQFVAKEIPRLEARLIEIETELFGEAATDYVRAAALEDERIQTEDLLMQLYEEEENFNKEDSE
ncbi:MAG: ATP-binding cassette domain-containing protein [Clostridia bacterium]|nr:ATP-binding cassette domain-containing protein [Clostridia bacterium]